MRNEVEHRVFWLTEMARRILRVRNEEATGSPDGGLLVAHRALVAVKPGAQARRIGQRGQVRILTGVCPERHVIASVANGLKLDRARSSFIEQRELVDGESLYGAARSGRASANAGILLREAKEGEQKCDQRGAPRKT